MLTYPVIQQLKSLKLYGMAAALEEQVQETSSNHLSFEERLGLLVDREQNLRGSRALQTRLRQAKLHISHAALADIDYRSGRGLEKKHIAQLATGQWLEEKQNLILLTSPTEK